MEVNCGAPRVISVGQTITVRALHADGECYRHWQATVERVDAEMLVTTFRPGQIIHNLTNSFQSVNYLRTFYWFERLYNLIEVYTPAGAFAELYINIASKPHLQGDVLAFTDHELDVSMMAGQPPLLLDEDEFEQAIALYGYTPEFVSACRSNGTQALIIAETWVPEGITSL
jgi:protein associated with RNAse G/E